jgi:hypothetical protein
VSGYQGANLSEGGDQFTQITPSGAIGSALLNILTAEAIVPGSQPSYQLCKDLFAFHPLGAKLAEAPINMAQSQEREISVPLDGEERIVEAFKREWMALGGAHPGLAHADLQGADALIKSLKAQSRIYGIATLIMGDRNKPGEAGDPIDWEKLHDSAPYFTVLDPLNTAGSLVLDQDPNSPTFQRPTKVRVGAVTYHPSRTMVVINEMPLFIEWSSSAFGFSGRSVYQRALYPLKTFLQTMITDQWVTLKVGLLVAKQKAPGSIQNNRILQFFGFKRSQLKAGITGNVLSIGTEEDIASLNFQNLEGPAKFARDNCLKNIAMAASMPSKLLEQEEMIGGMAEGTEDAKQIARYIDRTRIEMTPIYAFFDRVVQRRAWTPDFYAGLKKDYSAYRNMPYLTAFYQWSNAFTAKWPNLLEEPDSEKIKVEDTRFKAVVALLETMAPLLKTEENRAALAAWGADEINSRRKLFTTPLMINEDAEAKYEPPVPDSDVAPGAETKEPSPAPFSERT